MRLENDLPAGAGGAPARQVSEKRWLPMDPEATRSRARPWRVCAERDIDCAEVLLFTPGFISHDICCHGFHDVRRGLAIGREAHGRFIRGEQSVEGLAHER